MIEINTLFIFVTKELMLVFIETHSENQ